MSQCPLGFKGTPPPGHPKVAGLDNTPTSGDATNANSSEKAGWNPWLLLLFDAIFILAAIYIARNGVPRAIADPVRRMLGRGQARVDAKTQ
ncbi:uncharacterized protein MEPE_03776 [Melanopsichium pennsylvanicum]|uniref:Uncharacterized protein n=1 Tax=Melanopsichium pennsylvanicum TaxID=63383 RepID=A0AAJ5C5S6_9BASI|nr:uncharacterized protein MEPE_03776 [Melanopsichium pennsylvanicum]